MNIDTQISNTSIPQNPAFQQQQQQQQILWDQLGIDRLQKKGMKNTLKGSVYNFLERPTGWKCFVYHFTV